MSGPCSSRLRWLPAAATVLAMAGCVDAGTHLSAPVRGTAAAPDTTPAVTQPSCTAAEAAQDPLRSYAPTGSLPEPGRFPAGSTMERIFERGRLVVGVSGDTLLFGARNPISGAIEGFDIDMLKAVALAIFDVDGTLAGDPTAIDRHIEFRVITYAQRLPKLEADLADGGVDIVAHTMTINCNRWLRIAFSSTYFDAGQKVLVRDGSGFGSIDDLAEQGARVCAPEGSTNIDELRNNPRYAAVVVVGRPDITDCLVAMQQGDADATTGDDTVLAGFAAQDPNTRVVGEAFTAEPYGLGMRHDEVDFVRFVNGVIERMRTNGQWDAIYQRWLIDTGALDGPVPDPPPAVYGR